MLMASIFRIALSLIVPSAEPASPRSRRAREGRVGLRQALSAPCRVDLAVIADESQRLAVRLDDGDHAVTPDGGCRVYAQVATGPQVQPVGAAALGKVAEDVVSGGDLRGWYLGDRQVMVEV